MRHTHCSMSSRPTLCGERRKTYKNLCGQMVDQTGRDVGFLDQEKCSGTREDWESSRDCEQSCTSSRVWDEVCVPPVLGVQKAPVDHDNSNPIDEKQLCSQTSGHPPAVSGFCMGVQHSCPDLLLVCMVIHILLHARLPVSLLYSLKFAATLLMDFTIPYLIYYSDSYSGHSSP